MQEAFGRAELFAAESFAVFGVRLGEVDADGAPLGMQDIGEGIGEAAHGGGGLEQVQPRSLLRTTTVPTALWFGEPCW